MPCEPGVCWMGCKPSLVRVNHSVSLTLGCPSQAAQCPAVLQGGPSF